jgi:hypothetical protein
LAFAAGLSLVPLLAGCTRLLGTVDLGGFLCFAGLFAFVVVILKIAGKGGKGGGGSGGGGGISFWGGGSDDGGSSGCGSSGCGGGGCGGGGGD